MDKKNNIFKTILKVLGYILCGLVVALAAFSIFITAASKKDSDGTATVFNYQLRLVQSSSMEKSEYVDTSKYTIKDIKVKSCIFIEKIPDNDDSIDEWYSKLEVGDVLTFKYVYVKQETITHRIIEINKNENNQGYTIKLQGDNRSSEDGASIQTIDTSLVDSKNYVIGKVVGQSYFLGLLIYTLKTPIGIVCVFIIPCVIIIVYEIIRIVRVFVSEKKEKINNEMDLKNNEIEELKKRLEELEKDKVKDKGDG